MKNRSLLLILFLLFCMGVLLNSTACKNTGPASPYDLAFSSTPTQIIHITGPVNVAVQDKSQAVTGLTVYAIPPSGAATYSASTTTTGIATFNPPYLEVGNWTFVVPAQTPFPFAPSTITMPVSVANEQANFNSSGPTIQMTPPIPAAYTGTNGGVFVYGLSYTQPGSLLIPVKLGFPSLPANWSRSYAPTTIGYVSNDSATVTITGSSCVDQPLSFAVTALDLEPTPFPRANSNPQTITKNFTSTVTVTWYSPNFNNISNCNVERQSNAGTLTVSSTNSCATVNVWINEPSTNCTSGLWNTPNGNTNAEGGVISFGPGSYSCQYTSDGGFPTFHASCSSNGASGSVQVGNGTFTVLSTSY
jgi:hypothetical protein